MERHTVEASTTVAYNRPQLGEEEIAEVTEVLRSGWLTTGAKTKLFEDQFAEYVGAKHALGVSSCTAGLELCLAAHGIGPGDEVIVPTLTFAATANVVVHRGAKPVLVDVDTDGQIAGGAVQAAITERTKAILPVHYAGQACELKTIRRIAAEHELLVVEDAAHAAGSSYDGKLIGSSGTAVFSFYVTKNMTTGEGGMIATDDDELFAKLRPLSLHGITADSWQRYHEGTWDYEVVEPGLKANMTDVQAAIGIHQLRRLEGFMSRRREIALRYDDAFAGYEMLLPRDLPARPHGYHLYPVGLPAGITRKGFVRAMTEAGIGISVHFKPLHRQPLYKQARRDFPAAERIYSRLLSLPLYPAMSDDDVEYVCKNVRTTVVGLNSAWFE